MPPPDGRTAVTNVELVAALYAFGHDYVSFNDQATVDALMRDYGDMYDPEFELHVHAPAGEAAVHGIDAYFEFMRDWLAPWESYAIAADELIDLERDKVVALVSHRGHMKDGGAEVGMQGLELWTLRDGRYLRLDTYLDRAEGLRAAGLQR